MRRRSQLGAHGLRVQTRVWVLCACAPLKTQRGNDRTVHTVHKMASGVRRNGFQQVLGFACQKLYFENLGFGALAYVTSLVSQFDWKCVFVNT